MNDQLKRSGTGVRAGLMKGTCQTDMQFILSSLGGSNTHTHTPLPLASFGGTWSLSRLQHRGTAWTGYQGAGHANSALAGIEPRTMEM